MSGDELMEAVRTLVDLERWGRAQQGAALLPDHLPVADVLRAADGAHQLARALAALRRDTATDAGVTLEYDPHDMRSLYS